MLKTARFINKIRVVIVDISEAFSRGLWSVIEDSCVVSGNRKTDSIEAAAGAVQRRLANLKDLTVESQSSLECPGIVLATSRTLWKRLTLQRTNIS